MKRILILMMAFTIAICSNAQNSNKEIIAMRYLSPEIASSSNFKVGSEVKALRVENATDKSLITCPIICKVMQRRKSNIFGQEGYMVLRPLYIETPNKLIPLEHDDIYIRGKNRCNVKFWLSWTVIMVFVPGTGAKIKEEDRFVLTLK
ncbi:hypothetical protein [Pseudoprevotella muciniphila]|nr:hypothetical protein [Pseudoprevotella muciniphila]